MTLSPGTRGGPLTSLRTHPPGAGAPGETPHVPCPPDAAVLPGGRLGPGVAGGSGGGCLAAASAGRVTPRLRPRPTGEHCEVSARSGRCANGVCRNGGTCVNLLVGGFRCVCPAGEFERPYCEVTARSFPPRSFVTFRGLRQRFHFTVSLT